MENTVLKFNKKESLIMDANDELKNIIQHAKKWGTKRSLTDFEVYKKQIEQLNLGTSHTKAIRDLAKTLNV